jgi:osmoprotectant transport system permease protein
LSQLWDYVTTWAHWWGPRGLVHGLLEHIRVSVVSVAIAALIAIPMGLVLGHVRRGGVLVSAMVNIGRAVPSFAIVSLVFPISLEFHFQLGFLPTVVAMVLLGLPPMFTNTYTGVVTVDAGVVEAAKGMGMRAREVLTRVETPNALPLILTGVRVAAVQIVATATLGALVGFGGLGRFIVEGLTTFHKDRGELLAGAVFVAVLAIAVDVALGRVERAATPWVRRRPGRAVESESLSSAPAS